MRNPLVLTLMCCVCGVLAAAPACDAPALNSPGYARSIKLVNHLPEVVAWSRTHKFPVAFGESVDKQELLHGHCYWSVSVYANRPERLELWRVFYVDATGKNLRVLDPISGTDKALR